MANERMRSEADSSNDEAHRELSVAKFVAIGLLLAGRPYTDVASEVGIDLKTLHRWRQEPDFVSELRAQCELIREASLCGLFSMAAESINALRSALRSQSEPARVSAAQTVLERLGIREKPFVRGGESVSDAHWPGTEFESSAREAVLGALRGLDDAELISRVRAMLVERSS